jgi:hypothetical protein
MMNDDFLILGMVFFCLYRRGWGRTYTKNYFGGWVLFGVRGGGFEDGFG